MFFIKQDALGNGSLFCYHDWKITISFRFSFIKGAAGKHPLLIVNGVLYATLVDFRCEIAHGYDSICHTGWLSSRLTNNHYHETVIKFR